MSLDWEATHEIELNYTYSNTVTFSVENSIAFHLGFLHILAFLFYFKIR